MAPRRLSGDNDAMKQWGWLIAVLAVGCGDSGAGVDAGGGTGQVDAAGVVIDSGPRPDAESCQAPDMLIVLDRTMSMHRRPDGTVPADTPAGHMESKWYVAITAIETLSADFDQTIRFGLELFPRDPGGDVCVTLSQRINGTTADNPTCEEGEVLVSPGIGTGAMIAGALDPETTVLCNSTPIGAGVGTAVTHLASIQDPIREQLAVLITDGQDTCDEPLSLGNVHALAAAGVNTYVISFDASGGVDRQHLNDLACAGHTAPGFPAPCTDDGAGNYTATDPGGATLFLDASDAGSLTAALEQVAGEVCCDCIE